MKERASEHYQRRRGNCAQSVAFAWNTTYPDRSKTEDTFAGCGGGRAPDGLCGALHASCTLADATAAEAIKLSFAEKSGGHVKCREIRKAKTLPCCECVEVAAELLEKHTEEANTHIEEPVVFSINSEKGVNDDQMANG
jgi:hypothetical protein